MSTWYGIVTPAFQPSARVITGITRANPAVVTTGINHLYINNMIVRIDMYSGNGMKQMDQQFGPITILSPTTFSIPIDSTGFDAFVLQTNPTAQAVPFGEVNNLLNAAVQNLQPGGSLQANPVP